MIHLKKYEEFSSTSLKSVIKDINSNKDILGIIQDTINEYKDSNHMSGIIDSLKKLNVDPIKKIDNVDISEFKDIDESWLKDTWKKFLNMAIKKVIPWIGAGTGLYMMVKSVINNPYFTQYASEKPNATFFIGIAFIFLSMVWKQIVVPSIKIK